MNLTTTPTFQSFNIEGINHISPTDAFDAIRNDHAFLIDVREPDETMRESVRMSNVILSPMSAIMENAVNIPKGKMLITACPGGVRSLKVAEQLIRLGFKNVVNLDGGLKTWKSMGLPFHVNVLYNQPPVDQSGTGVQKPWLKPSEIIPTPYFKKPE